MKAINYSKQITLVAVAVLGAVTFSIDTHANDVAPAQNRAVQVADLDLNSAAGAQVFYRRVRHAAEVVCGDVGSRQLEQAAAAQACVERAIIASVRAVNNPQVTRMARVHGYGVHSGVEVAALR